MIEELNNQLFEKDKKIEQLEKLLRTKEAMKKEMQYKMEQGRQSIDEGMDSENYVLQNPKQQQLVQMSKRKVETRHADFGTKFEDGPTGIVNQNELQNRDKSVYASKKPELDIDFEAPAERKEYQPEYFEDQQDYFD